MFKVSHELFQHVIKPLNMWIYGLDMDLDLDWICRIIQSNPILMVYRVNEPRAPELI